MKNTIISIVKKEDGSVTVIVSIAFVALLTMCALVADIGNAYVQKSAFQNAVDSATLAGALKLPNTSLATATTREYMQKNGFNEDVSLTFSDNNNSMNVQGVKTIKTYFAKIINYDSLTFKCSASGKKQFKAFEGVFGYRLFSGSNTATLSLGGTFNITGDVHSNGSLSASPSSGVITGRAEACNSLYINQWTTTVGSQVPNASYVPMTDFSEVVNGVIPTYFDRTYTAADINKIWTKQYFTGNTKIIGNCNIGNQAVINGNLYVEGNLTIGGGSPACTLNGSIYATGSITFSNTFNGSGFVFAKNSILFQGGGAIVNSQNPICIYSETGNISFTTASTSVSGIIYAPVGTVNVQGGTTTFYGSIIGNQITGIPSNLQVRPPDVAKFSFLPQISNGNLTQ